MDAEKKKVFISGPMDGIDDYNRDAFNTAEQMLTKMGYAVFNPRAIELDDTFTRQDYMTIDIAALSRCDYIYLLDGYAKSRGAVSELSFAVSSNIQILNHKLHPHLNTKEVILHE